MIQINLIPGPKKKKGGGGFRAPDFKALLAGVKDPVLLAVAGIWTVGLVAVGVIWTLDKTKESGLDPQLREIRNERRQFVQLIAQRDNMEALRDSLEAELASIREIDADRYIWPHIIQEVTDALPEFTWLVNIDDVAQTDAVGPDGEILEVPVRFAIEGRTSNLQAYTRFARQLAQSPWFRDIQLGQTQAVTEDERMVQSFQILGTFVSADSSNIRTVPVTEAVR